MYLNNENMLESIGAFVNLQMIDTDDDALEMDDSDYDTEDLDDTADLDDQTDVENGAASPEPDKDTQEKPKSKIAQLRDEYKASKKELIAMKAAQKARDDFYADLAKEAGYTDIATEAEYRARLAEQSKTAKAEREAIERAALAEEALGLSPEKALAFIKLMGGVQPTAQQPLQPQPQQQQAFSAEAEITEFNKTMKMDLKEWKDITSLDNAQEVIRLMRDEDKSLTEAYIAANLVSKKAVAATKQELLNQLTGHKHVQQKQGGGNIDTAQIPRQDILAWAKDFNMSFADAEKDIRKRVKEGKYFLGE